MNLNLRATGPLRMLGVQLPEDEWLGELAPVQGNHTCLSRQLTYLQTTRAAISQCCTMGFKLLVRWVVFVCALMRADITVCGALLAWSGLQALT